MPNQPLALIIEDDPPSGEALSFIVADWGAEVAFGRDGDEAEAAIAGRFDDLRWIITDFHLGDGPHGISVVQRLVAFAPHARVLVLSGSFHGKAQAVAATTGYELMQKPARASAIIAWLEAG